jgi:hypothetical protein
MHGLYGFLLLPIKLEGREGERLKEDVPRRAKVPLQRRNSRAVTPTDKGTKPLKRGRRVQQCLMRLERVTCH